MRECEGRGCTAWIFRGCSRSHIVGKAVRVAAGATADRSRKSFGWVLGPLSRMSHGKFQYLQPQPHTAFVLQRASFLNRKAGKLGEVDKARECRA